MPDESGRSNTQAVVVLVAIVGLLASVGSAALGGYWANKSVERQLKSERSAEIQDQRRAVYVAYLRSTTQVCEAYDTNDDAKIEKAAVELLNQQGRVLLLAGPALKEAVARFSKAVEERTACNGSDAYRTAQTAFLEAAQSDLK